MSQLNPFATKWYFRVRPDGADKRTLEYVDDAASADLTLEMKADGSATLKGKIGTYAISAASFVSSEAKDKGAVIADFTPVVKIGTASKVTSISTNLWFDRLDVGHDDPTRRSKAFISSF